MPSVEGRVGQEGSPYCFKATAIRWYQIIEKEKRFDLSPDGGRLNVSAGLAVPEGRLEQEIKASCSNRHGQIVS